MSIDKYNLAQEVFSLVDATPMGLIDISDLVIKYTENEPFETQRSIRANILATLRELQSNGEIQLYENGYSITTSVAGKIVTSSIKVKSTYSRVKELKTQKPSPTINIDGDVIGSVIGNHSLEHARINPTIQITKNAPKKKAKTTSVIEYIYWCAGILIAIIALWEFLLKSWFHKS